MGLIQTRSPQAFRCKEESGIQAIHSLQFCLGSIMPATFLLQALVALASFARPAAVVGLRELQLCPICTPGKIEDRGPTTRTGRTLRHPARAAGGNMRVHE